MTWFLAYAAGLFLAAYYRALRVTGGPPPVDWLATAKLGMWPLYGIIALGTWTAERTVDAIFGSYRLSPEEKRLALGCGLTEEEVAIERGRRGAWLPRVRHLPLWVWRTIKRAIKWVVAKSCALRRWFVGKVCSLRQRIRRRVFTLRPKRTAWDMLEPGLQVVVERLDPEWAASLRSAPAPKSYAQMMRLVATIWQKG